MNGSAEPTRRRTLVKICGLSTEDAVDAAIDAGADFVGFVLVASTRRVTIARAAELVARVRSRVATVAVYRHPEVSLVESALAALKVDFHQSDAADFAGTMRGVPMQQRLPVVRMDGGFAGTLGSVAGGSATGGLAPGLVLVEGVESGTGETIDWSRLAPPHAGRIMLAGGLNPTNVARAIRITRPHAVDVSSGVESAPAIKDPDLIRIFIQAVRNAEHTNTPNPDHSAKANP